MTEPVERFLAGIVVAVHAQMMCGRGRRSSRSARGGEHGMELIQAVILAAGLAIAAIGVVAIISSLTTDTATNIKTK